MTEPTPAVAPAVTPSMSPASRASSASSMPLVPESPVQPSVSSVASGLPPKWVWAVVGGLGVAVAAVGTTVVMQQRQAAGAVGMAGAAGVPGAALPPAQAPDKTWAAPMGTVPPLSSKLQTAPALGQGYAQGPVHSPVQGQGFAQGSVNGNAPAQGPAPQAAMGEPAMAPGAGGMPPPAARGCSQCGYVESVRAVERSAPATGVGAVAGGLLGAAVGNQVGKGNGRAAATVVGAVGGGYVGHKVEQRVRTTTVYQIGVRMEDGSLRQFQRKDALALHTPVRLQGKGFRVDDGSAPPPVQQARHTARRTQQGPGQYQPQF